MSIYYRKVKLNHTKLLVIFLLLLNITGCISSGNIVSKYNKKNIDDTLVLNFYNGLDSENYNNIEITRYFQKKAPLKYALKIWYNTDYPINIKQIYLSSGKKNLEIKTMIMGYNKPREGFTTEMRFYKLEKEHIDLLCSNKDFIIKLKGISGSAEIIFLESHYKILDKFCDRVLRK